MEIQLDKRRDGRAAKAVQVAVAADGKRCSWLRGLGRVAPRADAAGRSPPALHCFAIAQ